MAGIFDLHLLQGLQTGWPAYAASLAAFQELFVGVTDDLTETWWTQLRENKPQFRAGYAPGRDDLPIVVVQLESESESERGAIGLYTHAKEDGRRVQQMIVTQVVTVTIITKHPEITRALHVGVRAIVMRLGPQFQETYLHVRYVSAEDLAPDEALVAEDLGVYVRRQRYEGMGEVDVPELVAPATSKWAVQSDDILNPGDLVPAPGAGVPGRVALDLDE